MFGYIFQKWEQCFFENDEIRSTRSFLAMWASRDVILRAAALQLFSNLTTSPKAADEIVNGKHNKVEQLTILNCYVVNRINYLQFPIFHFKFWDYLNNCERFWILESKSASLFFDD